MWSLGVLIAELCIGQTLFVCTTREEMVKQISTKIGTFCPVKFSGGMFSHILTDMRSHLLSPTMNMQTTYAPVAATFCYSTHLKSVKRLLQKHLPPSAHSGLSYEFIHFLGGLLMLDPKLRLTPLEALSHPFLSEHMCIPLSLIAGNDSGQSESIKRTGNTSSKSGSGSGSSTSQSRMVNASIAQLRRNSLHNHSLVPRTIPKRKSLASNHHIANSGPETEARSLSKYNFVPHKVLAKNSKESIDLSETESYSTSDTLSFKRSYLSETSNAPVSKFSKFL